MSALRTWFGSLLRSRRLVAKSQRPLGFEALEIRRALAVDNLGAIAGTVFSDLTNNGKTADDVAVVGATLKLYKDGGNGAFNSGGGDDVLVNTTTTAAGGKYQFSGLTAGRYYVQEVPVAGMQTGIGANPIIVDLTAADVAGIEGLIIDSFEGTAQGVEASNTTTTTTSSSQTYAESIVLGGERDLYAKLTSANGNVGLFSNQDVPHVLEFTSSSSGRGDRVVTWDGVDGNPTTLNPSGLGNKDLTQGGTMTGFRLDIGADHAGGSVTLRVYSGAGNYSEAVVAIPETGGTPDQFVYAPFSSFVTKGGTGANFTQVGAIQMDISGVTAVDGQVEAFRLLGPNTKSADFLNVKQIDLMITKSDGPDPVNAGQQLTYTIVVKNNGPADATGVKVTDPLPGNVTFVSATSTQGTVNLVNGTVNGDLGGLAVNGIATITVIVTPTPDFRGVLTNEATVTGNEVELDLTNNKSTVTTNVVGTIDLQVVKADTPDPVVAGQQITYTMVVTNNGPSAATGVKLSDPLPANVTYVSATSTQGTVGLSGSNLAADLGNLGVGGSATITLVVKVDGSFRGTLTNTATVVGNETETTLTNNTSTVTTAVNATIDLAVDKSDSPDPVNAGGTLTYTVVVTNNGPSAATGVKFVDTLPAGLTFVSASPAANVTVSGNTITGNIGNLAVGQSVTYTLVTKVGPTVSGTITNTVTVTGNETDSNPSNNTDTEPTTIELILSSIAGYTYVDGNNNGIFDTNELPISNVTVRLTGTTLDGQAVDRVLQSDFDGSYLFDNLLPGTYQVTETQPTAYNDGKDTQGNPQLGTVSNDAFQALLLAAGVDATNYNFGERDRPITPSDTPLLSKFFLLV